MMGGDQFQTKQKKSAHQILYKYENSKIKRVKLYIDNFNFIPKMSFDTDFTVIYIVDTLAQEKS